MISWNRCVFCIRITKTYYHHIFTNRLKSSVFHLKKKEKVIFLRSAERWSARTRVSEDRTSREPTTISSSSGTWPVPPAHSALPPWATTRGAHDTYNIKCVFIASRLISQPVRCQLMLSDRTQRHTLSQYSGEMKFVLPSWNRTHTIIAITVRRPIVLVWLLTVM